MHQELFPELIDQNMFSNGELMVSKILEEFNIEFEIEELIPQNLGTVEAITGFVKSRCNRE